jgi:uncharacterized membrane protein (TIGR01666 family)
MDYIKEYKSFVNSHYLSESLRITAGLTLPSVLLGYFHDLSAGIIVSLGASCVIIVDNPGPIRDRRNAMFVCDLAIFVVALLTGFFNRSPISQGLYIFLICLCFSMIAVFGTRAGSIGLAALFVMVLDIDSVHHGWQIVVNALYVFSGGLWYTALSLLLYSFRPYKLARQALGDCIQSTADYLNTKASFYSKQDHYDKNYQRLFDQQASLHEKQNLVRDLLFKSRDIVKESTHTGRILVMIFLDTVDLFELVMSSHQDYHALHQYFDGGDIMEKFKRVIEAMAEELDEIGIDVKSGKPSAENSLLNNKIKELKIYFDQYRDQNRTAANVEGFISLRQILENIEDIADRLQTLHHYTTYDLSISKQQTQEVDYEKFVSSGERNINPKLLRDNLSWQSNIFRHSMRVAIATLTGYIVSQFFPLGHSYWILLTIIVILKPAYSLTKKRNYDRLIGTLTGAAIGLGILYFIKERDLIFTCMILLMIGAYSFMRNRYLVFVILMTPYILLLFYLLNPSGFASVLVDRVIDTCIGSTIAFFANLFIAPAWEHEQFRDYLLRMEDSNTKYFADVASSFVSKPVSLTSYKLSRKQAFVALANLSDGFNRMMQEPRRKQKNLDLIYQFVVLNHMLTSHIATLSSYADTGGSKYRPGIFLPVIESIEQKMKHAKAVLVQTPDPAEPTANNEGLRALNEQVKALVDQRKSELDRGITESETRKQLSELKPVADQFNFIFKNASDIEKLCYELKEQPIAQPMAILPS